MGFPMALRLIKAGYTVTVFDLNPEPLEQLSKAGANVASNAKEAARSSDVLLTSLPRPDHVETVMITQETLPCLSDGSLWIDLTTNRKEFIQELAEKAPKNVLKVLKGVSTGE